MLVHEDPTQLLAWWLPIQAFSAERLRLSLTDSAEAPTDQERGGFSGVHRAAGLSVGAAAQRFVVLAAFANAAILDKETGLVWEQSTAMTALPWLIARSQCADRTTGGRKGWRLPWVHEQASLVDPFAGAVDRTLPPGHPFTNIQASNYRSATTHAEYPTHTTDVTQSISDAGYETLHSAGIISLRSVHVCRRTVEEAA